MTKQRHIILKLVDGEREFIGNDYEVRETALGLHEVWDTTTGEVKWRETLTNGQSDLVSISIL